MISEEGVWKGRKFTNFLIDTKSANNLAPIRQVSAICFDKNGKILIIKDSKNDYWSLPGGTPEIGETVEETLIREVNEEASCEVEPLELLGAIKVSFPNNDNKSEGEVFYQLRYVAKIIKINKQTIDPAKGRKLERVFVEPEEFLNYVTWSKKINQSILEMAKKIINLPLRSYHTRGDKENFCKKSLAN